MWGLSRAGAARLAVLLGLTGAGFGLAAFLIAPATPQVPVVQAGAEGVGLRSTAHPGLPARDSASVGAENSTGVEDRIRGLVLSESAPVELSIPRLGVDSRLVALETDRAGAMEVPRDPALAGWYALGPAPGALGPAVLAGHVTWDQVPAVFFRLGTLRSGDLVRVTRRDGEEAVFSVTRVARFEKSQFPTRAVFGPIDHAGLRLITCGGEYDASSGRYLDNVVVFASLINVREADD